MRPCQYIFLNKGLGMSPGKLAAQAGHAAVEGYRLSLGLTPHQPQEDREARENAVARNWYKGGHYMKLVMELPDSLSMFSVRDYLEARGFKTALIVDEGHTEGTYFVPTALGVEIVDKEHSHVQETFSGFNLYQDDPQVVILESASKMHPDDYYAARRLLSEGKIEEVKRLRLADDSRPKWRWRDVIRRSWHPEEEA